MPYTRIRMRLPDIKGYMHLSDSDSDSHGLQPFIDSHKDDEEDDDEDYCDDDIAMYVEMYKQNLTAERSKPTKEDVVSGERVDVFYGRTEGETGYKEYGAVIVLTTEVKNLRYSYDLYDPYHDCKYTILKEIGDDELKIFTDDGKRPFNTVSWITNPFRRKILNKYKEEIISGIAKVRNNPERVVFNIDDDSVTSCNK